MQHSLSGALGTARTGSGAPRVAPSGGTFVRTFAFEVCGSAGASLARLERLCRPLPPSGVGWPALEEMRRPGGLVKKRSLARAIGGGSRGASPHTRSSVSRSVVTSIRTCKGQWKGSGRGVVGLGGVVITIRIWDADEGGQVAPGQRRARGRGRGRGSGLGVEGGARAPRLTSGLGGACSSKVVHSGLWSEVATACTGHAEARVSRRGEGTARDGRGRTCTGHAEVGTRVSCRWGIERISTRSQ